jgi:hypothetical protein
MSRFDTRRVMPVSTGKNEKTRKGLATNNLQLTTASQLLSYPSSDGTHNQQMLFWSHSGQTEIASLLIAL